MPKLKISKDYGLSILSIITIQVNFLKCRMISEPITNLIAKLKRWYSTWNPGHIATNTVNLIRQVCGSSVMSAGAKFVFSDIAYIQRLFVVVGW